MNSPTLPEKNESFTPLSLDQLMKLKEEIFERIQNEVDKTKKSFYISYIALDSIDDARELCCRLDDPVSRFFDDVVHFNDVVRIKYSDILKPIFEERYNKISGSLKLPRDASHHSQTRDWFGAGIKGPLKNKIDLYYSQFIARKKIDTLHLKYTDSQNQYELETLLEQMRQNKLYDLKGVKSSLEVALNGALHVRKDTGKPVFLAHGEKSLDKSRDYLIDKITKKLPLGYELAGGDNEEYFTRIKEGNDSHKMNESDVYEIDPVYYKVIKMTKDLRRVGKKDIDGKIQYGVVNSQGKLITSCQWNNVLAVLDSSNSNTTNYYYTYDSVNYFIFDGTGNCLKILKIEEVGHIIYLGGGGFFRIEDAKGNRWLRGVGTHGLKKLVPRPFEKIRMVDNFNFKVVNAGQVGVINSVGKEIIPCIYDKIEFYGDIGRYTAIRRDEYAHVYDHIGDRLPIHSFKYIHVLADSKYLVLSHGDNYGVVNEAGEIIIDTIYDSIYLENHRSGKKTLLRCIKGGNTTIIDLHGTVIYDGGIDTVVVLSNERLAIKQDSGWRLADTDGERLSKISYKNGISSFKSKAGYYKVCSGDSCGIIDDNGNEVIPCKYADCGFDSYGNIIAFIKSDGIRGVLNESNERIVECKYDFIDTISDRLFVVKVSHKGSDEFSVVNKHGDTVVERFDSYTIVDEEDDGETTLICQAGNTFRHYKIDSLGNTPEVVKEDIDILNTLSDQVPSQQFYINHYLHESGPNTEYRKWKHNITELSVTPKENIDPIYKTAVQAHIEKKPELYLPILTAKPASKTLGDSIKSVLYPSTNNSGAYNVFLEIRKDSSRGMHYRDEVNSAGGIDTANTAPLDLRFEKTVSQFLTTSILSTYQEGLWKSLKTSYTTYQFDLLQTNKGTIGITDTHSHKIALPIQTNNFEVEKVEVLNTEGKRSTLEIEVQPEGVVTVDLPSQTKQVKYQFSNTILDLPIPGNISQTQYEERTKRHLAGKEKPFDYQYHLPQECEIFLDEIKKLSPKERVVKCEAFVRTYMWYDTENYNSREKSGKPLEQQIEMCMQHKSYLLTNHPELRDELGVRLFVGVCEDASNLLYILLCRTGILAGKLCGYMHSNEGRIPHARNYVLFPDENGNSQMYEIDGTPDNCTRQSASIEQKEIQIQKQIEQLELQGVTLHKLQKNIESTESVKSREQKRLNDLETTITQLIDMYHTHEKDELIAAAIEQKINQLPESLQSERREKYKQSKAA